MNMRAPTTTPAIPPPKGDPPLRLRLRRQLGEGRCLLPRPHRAPGLTARRSSARWSAGTGFLRRRAKKTLDSLQNGRKILNTPENQGEPHRRRRRSPTRVTHSLALARPPAAPSISELSVTAESNDIGTDYRGLHVWLLAPEKGFGLVAGLLLRGGPVPGIRVPVSFTDRGRPEECRPWPGPASLGTTPYSIPAAGPRPGTTRASPASPGAAGPGTATTCSRPPTAEDPRSLAFTSRSTSR